MIEIKYTKNRLGEDTLFSLLYELKKYIPSAFFEQHENGEGAELYFFISLLNEFGMFDCKKEHYHHLIWSTEYECVYNDIPFRMIYDEDYDEVYFRVSTENIKHRSTIAERIKLLILQEGSNIFMK